jgi:hypothetical protein
MKGISVLVLCKDEEEREFGEWDVCSKKRTNMLINSLICLNNGLS